MNFLKIGGKAWNVNVTELSRNFNVLYTENTVRSLAVGAPMHLDPLGTFHGHKIKIERKGSDLKAFDDLYDYVSQPRRKGIPVEVVFNQTTIKYDAYISNGEQALRVIKGSKVYWDELEINIIPMKAQVLP